MVSRPETAWSQKEKVEAGQVRGRPAGGQHPTYKNWNVSGDLRCHRNLAYWFPEPSWNAFSSPPC